MVRRKERVKKKTEAMKKGIRITVQGSLVVYGEEFLTGNNVDCADFATWNTKAREFWRIRRLREEPILFPLDAEL